MESGACPKAHVHAEILGEARDVGEEGRSGKRRMNGGARPARDAGRSGPGYMVPQWDERIQCDPTPSRLEAERRLGSSTFASTCTLPRGPHRGDGSIFDTDVVLQDGIGRI